HLHRADVRAEGYLCRQESVAAAVTRQEGNPNSSERADEKRIRRITERCRQADLFNFGEPCHLVKPTSADHSDACLWHYRFSDRRTGIGTSFSPCLAKSL